jgi:hypothetical protein
MVRALKKPLPSRGEVGVGSSHANPTPFFASSPHPNPSPEGEGLKVPQFTIRILVNI